MESARDSNDHLSSCTNITHADDNTESDLINGAGRADENLPLIESPITREDTTEAHAPTNGHRTEQPKQIASIQTLRAIAVLFVLLFHMWPSRFRYGYLGVDMFFVISGYLIFMLLSKKQPINLQKSADFYFRRVKRIVPIYLFVVYLALFAILRLISPVEFPQIAREAAPALGFYSNFPNTRPTQYFDVSSKFYFFLHTWSLSVEMQFYLMVPTLFLLLDLLERCNIALKVVAVGWIPLLSFAYQFSVHGDAAYMLLPARLWQFFVGFAAYYAYEKGLLNFHVDNKNDEKLARAFLGSFFDLFVFALLYMSFIYGLDTYPQLNRLLVIALTFLIIGRHNEDSYIFNNRWMVAFGDVSYSVYLVHWPLFTWHRYANMQDYTDGKEADFLAGSALIIVALLLGYTIETFFRFILKFVNSWSVLISVLFVGYALNALLLYELNANGIDLNDIKFSMAKPDADMMHRREELMNLWKQRHSPKNYTNEQMMSINTRLSVVTYCDNLDSELPTKFAINMSSYGHVGHVCHDRAEKRDCVRFMEESVRALEEWRQPIDVIIAFFPLFEISDPPLDEDRLQEDELFAQLQTFYSTLSRTAREAVIMIESVPVFRDKVLPAVVAQLKAGKPLEKIGDTKRELLDYLPKTRRRHELIECEKCIKLNLIDLWCGANSTERTFCHSVRADGLAYFLDQHHLTTYGSFVNGEHMRRLYDERVRRGKKKRDIG